MSKSMVIVLIMALAINAQARKISEAKANDGRAMSDVQQTSNPYLLDARREENKRVCRDTSRCSRLEGECLDRNSECDGEFIDGACDGYSCECCTPLFNKPKCEDRTSKQCSKASGVCQNKNKKCSGDIIKGACRGKNCHCCVEKTPGPGTGKCEEKTKCKNAGGKCQKKTKGCGGKIIENGCIDNKNCECCTDETTPAPTTQSPCDLAIAAHLSNTNELKMELEEIMKKVNSTLEEIDILQRDNRNYDLVQKLTQELKELFTSMDEVVQELKKLDEQYSKCVPTTPAVTTVDPVEALKNEVAQIVLQIQTINAKLDEPIDPHTDAAVAAELKEQLETLFEDLEIIVQKLKEIQGDSETQRNGLILDALREIRSIREAIGNHSSDRRAGTKEMEDLLNSTEKRIMNMLTIA